MSAGPLRVLVVGAGSIGLRHARNLAAMPWIRPVICPLRSERLEELRVQGLEAQPLEQALLAPVPDAVVVATDTGRHVADLLPWIEKGCWVLSEKPLSVDLASTRALGDYPRLRVACCLRANEALRWARKALPSLGTLRYARIVCQSYLPEWRPNREYRESYSADAAQGGVLRDLVHELDYAQWIFGKPARVDCGFQAGTPLGIASEAGADLLWTYESGFRLSMRLDYLSRIPRRELWVDGDQGLLAVDVAGGTGVVKVLGRPEERFRGVHPPSEMYVAQLKGFLAEVRGGVDPLPLPDLAEARQVLGIMDQARAAAAAQAGVEGRP